MQIEFKNDNSIVGTVAWKDLTPGLWKPVGNYDDSVILVPDGGKINQRLYFEGSICELADPGGWKDERFVPFTGELVLSN